MKVIKIILKALFTSVLSTISILGIVSLATGVEFTQLVASIFINGKNLF